MIKRWSFIYHIIYAVIYLFVTGFFISILVFEEDHDYKVLWIFIIFIFGSLYIFYVIWNIRNIAPSSSFDFTYDSDSIKIEVNKIEKFRLRKFTLEIQFDDILEIGYSTNTRYPGDIYIYYLSNNIDGISAEDKNSYQVIQWKKQYPDKFIRVIEFTIYFNNRDITKIRELLRIINERKQSIRIRFNLDDAEFCPNCGSLIEEKIYLFNMMTCKECKETMKFGYNKFK